MAVFIPVLFMGGVVGRVFNKFAVTISMAILISGLVSLTLTPMLCSRLLRPVGHVRPGRFYRASERAFAGMLSLCRRSLDWTLSRQPLMLLVTLATIVATIWGFAAIPKGFFPDEDTGLVFITTEGAQDVSFEGMTERQKLAADIVQADPNVDSRQLHRRHFRFLFRTQLWPYLRAGEAARAARTRQQGCRRSCVASWGPFPG